MENTVPVVNSHPDIPERERLRIADAIRQQLITFNHSRTPGWSSIPVVLTIDDKARGIVAGLTGRISWNWLFVEILWVTEEHRGQGYGEHLLQKAEHIASAHHCTGIHLDTFSFQAPEWYARLGYQLFGQIDGYPPGHTRYFFKKIL